MANDVTNVSVGKPKAAGGVHAAPVGTALPRDAKAALNAAFKSLGYVSKDGLSNSVDVSDTTIEEWGGNTVLNVVSSRKEIFKLKFIETNELVLKEVYGDQNVTGDISTGLTVLHNAAELKKRSYVFELVLTGNRVKRIVLPNAQVIKTGEISYKAGEEIGYEVEIQAYPDAQGNTVYEYISQIG